MYATDGHQTVSSLYAMPPPIRGGDITVTLTLTVKLTLTLTPNPQP